MIDIESTVSKIYWESIVLNISVFPYILDITSTVAA